MVKKAGFKDVTCEEKRKLILISAHQKSRMKAAFLKNNKCPRGDSNSYTFRRYPLKIVCLPISPLGLVKFLNAKNIR
jgi:hypothetical protein